MRVLRDRNSPFSGNFIVFILERSKKKQMADENTLELEMDAYDSILEKIKKENDPEKVQQLANAAAQFKKSTNEYIKIENDIAINRLKLEDEKNARKEEKEIASKQSKSDKAWKIFDGALALLGCAAGIALAFKTKSEEEDSYPKQPKTDMKASQLFDRAWKKNR